MASRDTKCQPLKEVHHVAHVAQAQRIITDGFVAASLVRDESRLNKSRLAVCWLSANSWAHGSIYGNVEFTMDWEQVVRGRRMYWVEAMPYTTPAYRFLITDLVLPNSDLVHSYDPRSADGPVIYREGTWYWNGSYTSEFMVADDLPLEAFSRVGFVEHHRNYCNGNVRPCPDQGMSRVTARLFIVSYILANSLHSIDHGIRHDLGVAAFNEVDQFVTWIVQRITNETSGFRGHISKRKTRDAVIRGVLALWSSRQIDDALRLATVFRDRMAIQMALGDVIAGHFGLPSYEPYLMRRSSRPRRKRDGKIG